MKIESEPPMPVGDSLVWWSFIASMTDCIGEDGTQAPDACAVLLWLRGCSMALVLQELLSTHIF